MSRANKKKGKEDDFDKTIAHRCEMLNERTTTYIENIPALVARYEAALERVKGVRGKHDGSAAATTSHTTSPVTVTVPSPKLKLLTTPKGEKTAGKKRSASDREKADKTEKKLPTATSSTLSKKQRLEAEEQAARVQMPLPPDNSAVLNEISVLKHEAALLNDNIIMVGEWITLMIPSIKEEDLLGAEIQMAIHTELMGLVKDIDSKNDLEFIYVESRANLENLYYKNFLANGAWLRCIEQADSDKWDELERGWIDLARVANYTYHILVSNMDKLKNPRPKLKSMLFMM